MSAANERSRPDAEIVAPEIGSFLVLITFPLSRTDWENNKTESGKHRHSNKNFLATLHELVGAKVESACYGYINRVLRNHYEVGVMHLI